jgi:uncharacterized protein (TIGR02145 family)
LDKCGGTVEYNPSAEQCCGSSKFTTATQFCFNGSKIGNKCEARTEVFDPDLYECRAGNKIYLRTPVSYGGESYEAVLIGVQTWLARNLNFSASGSCYGNSTGNCATYGRLYNWNIAMNVCPLGWHLPSNHEWDILMTAVGGSSAAGNKLKATSSNGTDDYGFAALLGGAEYSANPGFYNIGTYGHWWSSTPLGDNILIRTMSIYSGSGVIRDGIYGRSSQFSVRCVKD